MAAARRQVQYKKLDRILIASIRSDQPDRKSLKAQFEELYHVCGDVISGPAFSLFYLDSGIPGLDVEVCVPVLSPVEAGNVNSRMFPGGPVLSLVYQGPQDCLREAYVEIAQWAGDHGVNVENMSREVYISSNQDPPAQNLTEVQVFLLDWEQRLSAQVKKVLGKEACLAVMSGYEDLGQNPDNDQRSRWVYTAIGTLDRLTGREETYEILSRCAHSFSARRISRLREVYLHRKNVDEVLRVMQEDPDWYESPERLGRVIYVTKVPANRQLYEEAVTPEQRREGYCHCALAYRHLDTMPPAFCNCGAGWYRQLWEGILQEPVRVEITRSLTRQDDQCRFAIHLPDTVRI